MNNISLLVLTKDNQRTIGQCLQSASLADEIIVVDSGSTDRTLEICQRFTQKIYSHKWVKIGDQRNFALAQASQSWVLFLDSDEELAPGTWEQITKTVSNSPTYNGYLIPRLTFFLGSPLRHGGWHIEGMGPFRREIAHYDESKIIHEGLPVPEPLGRIRGEIYHYSFPHLEAYFDKFNRFTTLDSVELWQRKKTKRNKSVHLNPRNPFSTLRFLFVEPALWFGHRYILRQGFRDGIHGLIYAMLGAFNEFVGRAKYWDLLARPDNVEEKIAQRIGADNRDLSLGTLP